MEKMSELKTRILFGGIGVLLLILMLWIGGWVFDLFLVAIALIGAREIYSAFGKKGYVPQGRAGYLMIVIFYLQHLHWSGKYDFVFTMAMVIFSLSLCVWKKDVHPNDMAVTVLGFFYPGIAMVFAFLLRDFTHENYLLILALASTFATDTVAYFVGRKFGRKKLCPSISPGKTVEGSAGGLAGSVLFVILTGIVLNMVYHSHIAWIHFAAIGLLGGSVSQIGDLTASAIKRYCGIKDYGNIIPGHGGVLDRIDSLLFTLPVVYIYSLLFLI